jgi:hypothetical protein
LRLTLPAASLCFILALAAVSAQETRKPLNQNEIVNLLENGVPSSRVQDIARERGISFPWSAEAERQIRIAGASDELLKALQEIAPQPPPPAPVEPADATLLLEVNPGGARVYVDGGDMGAASPAGSLKVSRLKPGKHQVKLTLDGYRNHEQSLKASAGETLRLVITLEKMDRGAALLTAAIDAAGRDALSKLRTMQLEGVWKFTSAQMSFEWNTRGVYVLPDPASGELGRMRFDQQGSLGSAVEVIAGNTGWSKNAFKTEAHSPDEIRRMRGGMLRFPPVLLQQCLRGTVQGEFLAEGKIEGNTVNILQITDALGMTVRLILDGQTHDILKVSYQDTLPEQAFGPGPIRIEEAFFDYRVVDGLRVPFKYVMLYEGNRMAETTYSRYVLNPTVDGALFNRP